VSRPSHHTTRAGGIVAGALAMAAAIAALGPHGNFALIFLYVAATIGVCALATAATIRVLARLMHGSEATGLVEFGLLIGLFVVSPLALSGAFRILRATVGSL
jgi:hypothetical protein